MKLVSVNVLQPESIKINDNDVLTGINKQPQTKHIWLNKVIEEGEVDTDDDIILLEHDEQSISPQCLRFIPTKRR